MKIRKEYLKLRSAGNEASIVYQKFGKLFVNEWNILVHPDFQTFTFHVDLINQENQNIKSTDPKLKLDKIDFNDLIELTSIQNNLKSKHEQRV